MNRRKAARTFTLPGLAGVGKLPGSRRVPLPVLALCLATVAWSQTPRTVGKNGIPATSQYRLHAIEIPNATAVQANGINNAGLITGWYQDASYNVHGFTWLRGAVQSVDYPGAVYTYLNAVNSQGVAIGYYGDGTAQYAVTYAVQSGAWSVLPSIAGYLDNAGFGINDAGEAVGQADGYVVGYLAWIWHPSTQSYSFFTVPGAAQASTYPFGINNKGQAVGWFADVPRSNTQRGFLKEGDAFTNIDVPGAFYGTSAFAISGNGAIAGSFCKKGPCGGFVRTSAGVFTLVNVSGSQGTTMVSGVNDRGVICGYAYNSDFVEQAFVGYPR
jgi:uncharacterized membrane protein